MPKKRKLDSDEIFKFISLFKERVLLWDVGHVHHNTKKHRDVLICEIGEALNMTKQEVRDKIRGLQSQLSLHRTKIANGRQTGNLYTCTWPYFEALLFLKAEHDNEHAEHDNEPVGMNLSKNADEKQAEEVYLEEEYLEFDPVLTQYQQQNSSECSGNVASGSSGSSEPVIVLKREKETMIPLTICQR